MLVDVANQASAFESQEHRSDMEDAQGFFAEIKRGEWTWKNSGLGL
jgi:hypothetical protein